MDEPTTQNRYMVWSGNRISGTTTDYVIQVCPAFTKIVREEWVSCSIPGLVLQIEEFSNKGYSSNEKYFWRFVGELVNQNAYRHEPPHAPVNVSKLTIHWRNPDGSIPVSVPEHTLELELWS